MNIKYPFRLNTVVCFLVILFLSSCEKELKTSEISNSDKQKIKELARDLPLILSNKGWDAYEEKFSKDYSNWSMAGDEMRTRDEYLSLVKKWYEQGNKANGSTIKTIGYIPLGENSVMYLYALQERFVNPKDSTKTSVRDIRFVGNYRKENNTWKNTFTAFMDLPTK